MINLNNTQCCGVKEIQYIQDKYLTRIIADMCTNLFDNGLRCAIFTYTTNEKKQKQGELLTQYIREHRLGKVIESDPIVNPNSRNTIKHYTWQIDHKAMKAWRNNQEEHMVDEVNKAIAPLKVGDKVHCTKSPKQLYYNYSFVGTGTILKPTNIRSFLIDLGANRTVNIPMNHKVIIGLKKVPCKKSKKSLG